MTRNRRNRRHTRLELDEFFEGSEAIGLVFLVAIALPALALALMLQQ